MFHQGDLQSGIAIAIQESKSVACFVRDESEESLLWENEWLLEDSISQLLYTRAVVLRIEAGSQEAGFLATFCPVGVVPALALIHNGQLLDVLVKGVEKNEFETRLSKAFSGEAATMAKDTSADTPLAEQAGGGQTLASSARDVTPAIATPATTTPASSTPTTSSQNPRAEIEARTVAKGKGRADATPTTPNPAPAPVPAQARNDWIQQQKNRKSEARKDRERVMVQIEADKAERKARQEAEKKIRERASTTNLPSSPKRPTPAFKATKSNLQVRLLDGGTIREQFPATATLEIDVRPWIDEHLDNEVAYSLKHIIPPQPARAISVGEEHQSLRELDLVPSATLVLQPAQNFSDAYTRVAGGGLLSLPYDVVSGTYGLVSETLSGAARWLRGGQYEIPEGQDERGGHMLGQDGDEPRANEGRVVRIRTLADARMDGAKEGRELYNGNSLDFQPNVDDDDDGESSSKKR